MNQTQNSSNKVGAIIDIFQSLWTYLEMDKGKRSTGTMFLGIHRYFNSIKENRILH